MCPKLTKDHITNIKRSSFKKMRVRLATQVISRTVSKAIETAIQFQNLDAKLTPLAKPTAELTFKINRLFDLFNSRAIDFRDPYKAPLQKSSDTWKVFFEEMLTYLQNIKIFPNLPKEKKKYVRVFDGFVQNINAIKQLSSELFVDNTEINFILMGKFNQDIVENLFAYIRGSGGNNCTPSVRELCYSLRRLINSKVAYVPSYANSELDNMKTEISNDDQTLIHGSAYNLNENNNETLAA